jgi:uncharacterized protein
VTTQGGPQPCPRALLVWDAPNIDMSLGTILGTRPTATYRPRFDALGRWLLSLAGDDGVAEATVFTNVQQHHVEQVRPWVETLRGLGYAVFAKPKVDDSDVDVDMLAHIERRHAEGGLRDLVVASGDARAFRDPLEKLAVDGVRITVIGFREFASFAQYPASQISFVDLEEIEGVFREPLPRITLDNLPVEGAWLQPTKALTALLGK